MNDELLPCPFCGGQAHYWAGKIAFYDAECGCDDCGVQGPNIDDFPTTEENIAAAIIAWNTRV